MKNNQLIKRENNMSDMEGSQVKSTKQFEGLKLLLDISRLLENVEYESSDKITKVLERICTYIDCDRAHIALLSEDESRFTYSAQWYSDKTTLISSVIEESEKFSIPQLARELNENEYLLLSKDDSTGYSWIDKMLLDKQGIQSFLILPMKYNNKLLGFMDYYTLNKRDPLGEEENLVLKTVAHIFTTASIRKRTVTALKESENYYRTIFDNTGTAKLILDSDNNIVKVNLECEAIFGCRMDELQNTKWTDYFNEDLFAGLTENKDDNENNEESPVPIKYICKFKNKIRETKHISITANFIPKTRSTVITVLDLTELYQVKRALESISACNMAMIHATNEMELLQTVCEKITGVGGYFLAWVGYVFEDENRSIRPVARAGHEVEYLNGIKIYLNDPVLGNGPFGKAVKTRKPVITKSLAEDTTFKPWRDKAMKVGGRSLISFPLFIDGQEPFGVLGIGADETDVFDEAEVRILSEMASDLTYGIMSLRARIERDNYQKKLENNLDNLHNLLKQTVASLSNVVEMRDPYTAGHQRKVAELSAALAKELGLTQDEVEGVFIAGTIHDIGKVRIPSEILCKPGKLDPLEFEMIKSHCQSGYDIIQGTEYPWPIAKIILQHHEKVDGSGYPNGLKGEDIVIGARIIGVADVVEAMASHRPYRAALGLNKALEEIIKYKGTKFDANVVDACVKLFINKGFEF